MAKDKGNLKRRSAARLAAVQALYEVALSERSAALVLHEASQRGVKAELDGEDVPADATYFKHIVQGVNKRQEDLDRMLLACLDGKAIERLDEVLRAVLRAGAYELVAHGDVDAPVVINEYVTIAHAFFSGNEPAIANGVLDRLAKTVRDDDQVPEASAAP